MGSRQTQETSIPEASDQEKALFDMISQTVVPAYMEQAGYDVNPVRYNNYDDTQKAKDNRKQANDIQNKLDAMPDGEKLQRKPNGSYGESDKARQLEDQLKSLNNQYQDGFDNFQPYTEYNSTKRESPELEQLKSQYGVDSSQYKDAKAAATQKGVDTQKQQEAIQKQYMDSVQKYLSGDFSVTPEQEKFISDQLAPIKKAIEGMSQDQLEQIGKTSLKVEDALRVVGDTINNTGKDMTQALESTIATNKELMKMGIEDATGEITKRVSMQAIATGRDPSDPEYQKEIQTSVGREVSRGTLNLAQMESQGKLTIAERTGSGQEELAKAVARYRESVGSQEMGVVSARDQARIGTEQTGSNLRQQIGMGMGPSQIQVGSGYQQLDNALAAQRLQNAGAPASFLGGPINYFQGDRRAQPTTTTSQPFGAYDALSLGLGAAGAGASIYSGVATAGAYRDMAGAYKNSGSSYGDYGGGYYG